MKVESHQDAVVVRFIDTSRWDRPKKYFVKMCIRYIKQRKLSVIKVSFLHVSILFQTMERRLIATARYLTLRLKRGMNAASGTISTVSGRVLPTAVQNRFSQALKYTDDLYNSFSKVWFYWFISFNLVLSERPFSKSELGASKQTCDYNL